MVSMVIKIFFIVFVLISSAHSDTVLVGSDGSDYADTNCWSFPAATLENCHWKAGRYQAKNTGTISYFRMRAGATPTGCTNDSGCWAIYEAGTNGSLGALKAWTCFSGYNWTTIGTGWHTWNVEHTETNLTVTAGQYYWLVMHSYAIDATYYASAGCSAYIGAYRGTGNDNCADIAGLDMSGGGGLVEVQCTYTTPPTPEAFDSLVQTYVMVGVWDADDSPTTQSVSGGITILGGDLR